MVWPKWRKQLCVRNFMAIHLICWAQWIAKVIQIIVWKPWMPVQSLSSCHIMPIHHVSRNQNYRPPGGAKGKVSRIHPLGTLKVCTKYHGNPSNSCWSRAASTAKKKSSGYLPHFSTSSLLSIFLCVSWNCYLAGAQWWGSNTKREKK